MTVHHALRTGWQVVWLHYDAVHALVERQRQDGVRERALALRDDERSINIASRLPWDR